MVVDRDKPPMAVDGARSNILKANIVNCITCKASLVFLVISELVPISFRFC